MNITDCKIDGIESYTTVTGFPTINEIQSSINATVPSTDTKPVGVIIITQMRSGSSFTGEIFNKNDDFIYYFEPLYEVRNVIRNKSADLDKFLRLPLRNLLKCDFRNMPINWWKPRTRIPRNDCLYSRAFQTWPSFCKFNQTSGKYRPHRHVVDNVTKMENMCHRKSHVAIKTIRVEDIDFIRDIVEDPTLNVKVIHLVRDPRAVFISRKLVSNVMHKSLRNVSDSCPRLERNIQYWLDTPKWLQERYLIVRYEDLADQPLLMANDVYKFLGIKMPDSVKAWIKENTNHDEGNLFSRTRNSHGASIKWRTQISVDEVRYVQSRCKNVMRLLGYKEVVRLDRLRNLDYPLLVPMFSNRTLRKPNKFYYKYLHRTHAKRS